MMMWGFFVAKNWSGLQVAAPEDNVSEGDLPVCSVRVDVFFAAEPPAEDWGVNDNNNWIL